MQARLPFVARPCAGGYPCWSSRRFHPFTPDTGILLIHVVHWSSPSIIRAGMLPCTLLDEVGVRVRLLHRALVLANEAATRAGRGQATLIPTNGPKLAQKANTGRQATER